MAIDLRDDEGARSRERNRPNSEKGNLECKELMASRCSSLYSR
jgi:hypothetical protein